MNNLQLFSVRLTGILSFLAGIVMAGAATITEDFAQDPLGHGWKIFGNPAQFVWNTNAHCLEVTWDSARSNAFFYYPLPTVLAKNDDFSIAFDLQLTDLAVGTNPDKPFTFEIALGFVNLVNATNANFVRGAGTQSPNLVEWDYFADSGFGATVWPAFVSTNGQFNYSGAGDFTLLELAPGNRYEIRLDYRATNRTLQASMTQNGQPLGPLNPVVLSPQFSDYRVNAFAISSYSDHLADGSILAHGQVDNLLIQVPDPPVKNLSGRWVDNVWHVEFAGNGGWRFGLERSVDWVSWQVVTEMDVATPGQIVLADRQSPREKAWYRVRANRL